MKKKEIFSYAAFCLTLLLLMVPNVSAGWEDMEVLKYIFDIDAAPRYQQYPVVKYNSIDNEFMCLYSVTGPLRDNCDPGDEDECTTEFMSLDGRRVSPDGEILGNPIQLSPPEPMHKMAPSFAHNIFTNEYMLAFLSDLGTSGKGLYTARIDSIGDF